MSKVEDVIIQLNGIVRTSGLGNEKIATALGIDKNTLSLKLNGKTEFKLSEVFGIIDVCNYTGKIEISK